MIGVLLNGIGYLKSIHSGKLRWIDDSGIEVNDKTYGHGEVYLMYLILAGRVS
jgi:hypothetical protein